MEPCFINVSVDTVERLHEWYREVYSNNRRRFMIIFLVCALIMLALWIWERNIIALLVLGYYVYMVIRYMKDPRNQAKKAYERKLAYYDGTMPPANHLFYDDHLQVLDVDSSNTVPYAKVERVEFLQLSTILILKDGRVFMVSNDGFTKGTLAEFQEFIRSKCSPANSTVWKW